ncbi:MAG: NHLP leader peptide family RiPP precursor [Bacteroidota bacterium]
MSTFEIDYLRGHHGYQERSEETLRDLMAKATTDADFRSGLLNEPTQTLEAYSGIDFPEDFQVRFIESKADITLVLPDFIDESAEISEEELEAVAGGANPTPTTTWICSAIAVTALTLWAYDEFVERD